MKKNEKIIQLVMVIALVVSITGISVGFAAMSTTLSVSGVTEMAPASWKIKFENLSNPTLTGSATVVTAPVITGDTHIGDYSVRLTRPGDSVTYTFDVTNSGSIDAELSSFTFATPSIVATLPADQTIVQNNLVYSLTYNDGSSIAVNDELKAGQSKKLKLFISYPSTAEQIPSDTVNINDMDVTFIYSQK